MELIDGQQRGINQATTLGIAIIGLGYVSPRHLEAILGSPRATLTAVCDTSPEQARAIGERYRVPWFTDPNDIFEVPFDLASVCTPSGTHKDIALTALRHSRHVLIEKPLALTSADVVEVMSAATDAGLLVTTVFHNRFNEAVLATRAPLLEGHFGEIRYASAVARWYRDQSYYQGTWRGTALLDGGVLLNQGIHYIDVLLHTIDSQPISVYCKTACLAHDIETDDFGLVVIEFENGSVGTVEVSTIAYPTNLEGSLTILGTKGSAKVGGVALNTIETWRVDTAAEPRIDVSNGRNAHARVYESVIASILDGYPLYLTSRELLTVHAVVDAAFVSARRKERVAL